MCKHRDVTQIVTILSQALALLSLSKMEKLFGE